MKIKERLAEIADEMMNKFCDSDDYIYALAQEVDHILDLYEETKSLDLDYNKASDNFIKIICNSCSKKKECPLRSVITEDVGECSQFML